MHDEATSPSGFPSESPSPSTTRPSVSRRAWFPGGVVVGIALTIGAGLIAGGSPSTRGLRPADHASAAALAQLVARPLVPEGQAEPKTNEAEVMAALATTLNEVDALAGERTDLAPI